tara:strand:- start:1261 stop:1611 length:351 start_codon:yes stop_codon:yes gene_type:complete
MSDKNGNYTDVAPTLDRDPRTGKFIKGNNANPTGRPPAGKTIVEKFRENPNSSSVLSNIFQIASTLGSDKEHPKAFECAKLVADKLIPTLKAQDLTIGSDDKGFIYMPTPKESDKQ